MPDSFLGLPDGIVVMIINVVMLLMLMSKKTAVIACVTFETVMVSSPAAEYKADEVHLFHYVRAGSSKADVYSEFYAEAAAQVKSKLPNAKIIEHGDSPVYDFRLMLRDILSCVDDIRSRYEECEILINVSSGTAEFIAAGVISAMMSNGKASAFTVRTSEFTVSGDDAIRKFYYKDGKPVGLSSSVGEPNALPYFKIDRPDENLVRGLRLYSDLRERMRTVTAATVIAEMKKNGIWLYVPSDSGDKTEMKQKETMYYQRHFVNMWDDLGWIDRPGRKERFVLTPIGKNIVETFYID